MKISGFNYLLLVVAVSTPALAAEVAPDVMQGQAMIASDHATRPMFGYIEGSYILPEFLKQYNTVNSDNTYSGNIGPGAGYRGKGLLGYHFTPDWSVMAAFEYDRSFTGDMFSGRIHNQDRYSYLQDNYQTLDGMVGYNFSPDWRVGAGVRWVQWNNLTTDGGAMGSTPITDTGYYYIHNNFSGIGPRLQVDGSIAMFGNSDVTLEAGVGGSYLFGTMKYFAEGYESSPVYASNATTFNVDASVGVGYRFAQNIKAVIGVQGQYWNGINAARNAQNAINPNPANEPPLPGQYGKSSQLQAGPFVRIGF